MTLKEFAFAAIQGFFRTHNIPLKLPDLCDTLWRKALAHGVTSDGAAKVQRMPARPLSKPIAILQWIKR